MADLVVGLSKTAVQLLADKVKSAIKEEAEQWKTVQRDLVFITGEFEMMQSFLDTASEDHVRDRIVRTWVRQVRELSNDVEDNIDFVLHLDPTTKSSWWLRLVPSCGWAGFEAPPPPVDVAVAETTLLRARVVDVSQRNIRYNLISDSASASKPMPAAMDPVQKTAAASSFDVLINAVKKSGPVDLAGLVAREDRDLHVVSVCGAEGDLLKVAIVRKMYCDARICNEFVCRAWVKLVHPFNPHEFIGSLVTQFFTHSCQEEEEEEAAAANNVGLDALERMQQATQGDLIKEFAQKESNHRYLIVLEDLCATVQWDAIRSYLPDRKKGSRIVVLTHHPVVASQCTGEPCRVSELGQFLAGHAVRVYYREAFQHDRVQSIRKPEPHHSLFLGRDIEMDELFMKTQETRFISMWGMPGVGKSALIKAIYDVKLRTSDQFKRHAWVNVSHPFNPTEFCRSLLESFDWGSSSSKGKYAKELPAEDLINKCRDHLIEYACLFVIDGVQSNEDWDWIKSNLIPSGDAGSCIIIITSEESVAKHCAVSIDGVYNVKGLHATAANELFKKALEVDMQFSSWQEYEAKFHPSECSSWEEYEAKFLLSKCGGLPRVIISMARFLASKPRDGLAEEMMRLSSNFMQEVSTNPEFASLRDIQAWMHSYLQACPRHLKKYMLYATIFPQYTIVRRRSLIRRWIAEGYSKGIDSISLEKYAEKIFDEVAALSVMQPVLKASKVIGYRVNGFFREYIMSRPVEEAIFFPVEVSALEKEGHGHGRRLPTEGIGQHLAIGATWHSDDTLFESLDLSRLRSLTVFDMLFRSFCVSDRMRVLRVLDLENARELTDDKFNQIGKLPSRLKLLSLRGQRGISRLPEPVGGLVQLQTLDIRGTRIRMLPPFITRLRKLQYIRAGTTIAWTDDAEEGSTTRPSTNSSSCTLASCLPNKFLRRVVGSRSGGVEFPRGIDRLKALQTLGAVCVNTTDEEAILSEIVSFPQLKKLEISGISGNHGLRSLFHLYTKTHLESLSLQFEKNNHSFRWDDIRIPTSLRKLKVYGHVEGLPGDIGTSNNLVKLTLEMTTTLFTDALGRIPDLHTLRLRVNKDQDGELQFPSRSLFRKLQVLEIACESKLHVNFDEGAMGKLEQLKLHCRQGSEMQLSGLEHLVSLKQVWLLRSFDDALKKAVQQQLAKHPKIPAPKLEVRPR